MNRDALALIDRYLDGEISAEELERLEHWIQQNAANAQVFTQRAMLHSTLDQQFQADAAGQSVASAQTTPNELPSASPCDAKDKSLPLRVYCFFRRPTPLSVSIAATVMIAILTAMAFMAPPFYRSIAGRGHSDAIDPNQLAAQIVEMQDVVWADGQQEHRRGMYLKPDSKVRLESGLLLLEFGTGSRVAVEGPASFDIWHGGAGRLVVGKLAALVPPAAVGFRIDTPTSRIVDLGTEFGVAVDEKGESVVDVFDGTVEVALVRESSVRTLQAGESVQVTQSGFRRVEKPVRFVRASSIQPRGAGEVLANARDDFRPGELGTTTRDGNELGLPATGNGHWNYYRSDAHNPSHEAARLQLMQFGPAGGTQAGMYRGESGAHGMPAISSEQIFNSGEDGMPRASELAIHPGEGDDGYAVVRWTAGQKVPEDLRLRGRIRILGSNDSTDGVYFAIYARGKLVNEQTIAAANNRGIVFDHRVQLMPGQHVDFVVGRNSNFSNDQVGFLATISSRE